jgi:hypothetical protein
MTDRGVEEMNKSQVDTYKKSLELKFPDYELMRSHLKVGDDVNDSELIALWDETTDYYLPY